MNNLTLLWTRHTQQNDPQAREALILHYAQMVKYVVGRLTLKLPPSLQGEDLISFGVLGLIEAIDRFDPGRGVKFETFGVARIRGRIFDSLRQLDLLSRSARRQAKEIEQAMAHLSQSLGRLPTDAEVANHLGLASGQYFKRLLNTNSVIVSLDKPLMDNDAESPTLYDSLEDTNMANPSIQLEEKEMKRELVLAIQTLPERERVMLSLYYNEGLTMKEIAQTLGVSESRVSQMHTKAVLMLRSLMYNRAVPNQIICDRRAVRAKVILN
ncbi:MAG: FliA/WhiG family RNA polymerase sigma factor [Chloroflexi bacterium]|nr:FliA/WhiG family RNA polymerase sigma factor [Chloroflexota bacterium]